MLDTEKELLLKLKTIISRYSQKTIVDTIDNCIDENNLECLNKIYNDTIFNNRLKDSLVNIISNKLKELKDYDTFYLIDSNGYYPVEELFKCINEKYYYEGMYSSTSDDGDSFYFKEIPTNFIKDDIFKRLHLENANSIDVIDNSICANWLKEVLKEVMLSRLEINKI